MLPGFHGHLLSEFFLEQTLDSVETHMPTEALHRAGLDWRRRTLALGPASSLRTLLELGAVPLLRLLGFDGLHQVEIDKRTALAVLRADQENVALAVTGWGQRLDAYWRTAVVHATKNGASWCLLYNGSDLRVVDAHRLYSRRYVEFELDTTLDETRTFAVLASTLHARMFSQDAVGKPPLQSLVEGSERHASAVCRSLRDGVLKASADVLGAMLEGHVATVARVVHSRRPARGELVEPRAAELALRHAQGERRALKRQARHVEQAVATMSGRTGLDQSFEQALTIVYRILFLLFAEARGLLPLWHPVYRDSYSLDALRDAAERGHTARGLWDALRASSRLAHAGCRAGDLQITPFNGRLFAPSHTPLVDRRDLNDDAARRALLALSTRPAPDGAGQERIAYRDLGVEQLGAVYETLLDYTPRVVPHAVEGRPRCTRWKVSLEPGSHRRKATGSFYTPEPMAQYLVRRTLAPLVQDASPEQILALRVVDPAMGSGAFLVAACAFLGQAYEAALVQAGRCDVRDFGISERTSIRRTIAERCLYGVDVNPMAVQLARLSLWLATLAADRPLTFLDHHLRTGDSLIGAWLSQVRRAPEAARARAVPPSLPLGGDPAIEEALGRALPIRFSLSSEPNNTVEQVRAKERALAALAHRDSALSKWKRIADLWCARWFSANPPPASAFGTLCDRILMGEGELPDSLARTYLREADETALARRFFHWELEFPEAFFDVTGRPMVQSGFDAVVGNPPWDMIRADGGPEEERADRRREASATLRFTRETGIYTAQSRGHGNSYQLFVERATALAKRGGRIGLVLPAGFATDHGSASLRRLLFGHFDVDAIVGFENRLAVFPIHRSMRFLLLTATRGGPTVEIGCRLGEVDLSVLDATDDDKGLCVRVTPRLLAQLSGEDVALPDLRSPVDVAIAERAAALFRPLADENGWNVRFGRELNTTEDRGVFQSRGRGLPVVEGKQIEPFRAHVGKGRWSIAPADAMRLLGRRHQAARLAYRDVASATNKLTFIAAVLPAGCVSTHTLFCLRSWVPLRHQMFLCGLFNSLLVNYLVRLRVTTHVTTAVVERLPIPELEHAPGTCSRIAALARLLARRQDPGAFAALNALVAHLYRLTEEEFRHVLSTFPLIPQEQREAAMKLFQGGPR